MNRKLIFHLCILTALICLCAMVWMNMGGDPVDAMTNEQKELALQEGRAELNELTGEFQLVGEDAKEEGLGAGGQMVLGIGMLIVVAGYAAIVFVAYLLPVVVSRFTHLFYGSDEQVESDPMHDARALFAQGDFEGAIESYRGVAAEQPENRFPWVEISKIQHDNLEDPDAAIQTLRTALESYEWRVNDAAFFMFRLAGMYEADKADLATASGILQQVVDLFPETRHSANATHKLREMGVL